MSSNPPPKPASTPVLSDTETGAREDIGVSINPKDAEETETAASADPPRPPRSPSPNKCSICLGDLVNKCYTNSCIHQFCFGCLLEWSKVKPECPLCKSYFRSIYHNIRDMGDYDEYQVPASANSIPHLSIRLTTEPFGPILGADIDFRRREHAYSQQLDGTPQLFNNIRLDRLNGMDSRGVIRILEVGPLDQRRHAYDSFLNGSSSFDNPFYTEAPDYFGSYSEGTPATASTSQSTMRGYQSRRRIYDRDQWVAPFSSTLQPGTVFFPSIEYFRTHPTALARISPWLYREITVLLSLSRSRSEMGFVYDLIQGLLGRFDIRSREFREMIRTYFGARVKHFQHEFYYFVLSGMRVDSYDRVATYPEVGRSSNPSSASASTSRSSSANVVGVGAGTPPVVVTLGDSDDEVNGPESNARTTAPASQEADDDSDDIMVVEDVPPPVWASDGGGGAYGEDSDADETPPPRPRRPPAPPRYTPDHPENYGREEEPGHRSRSRSGRRRCRRHRHHPDEEPLNVVLNFSRQWCPPERTVTDADFPILNLRSRIGRRPTINIPAHLQVPPAEPPEAESNSRPSSTGATIATEGSDVISDLIGSPERRSDVVDLRTTNGGGRRSEGGPSASTLEGMRAFWDNVRDYHPSQTTSAESERNRGRAHGHSRDRNTATSTSTRSCSPLSFLTEGLGGGIGSSFDSGSFVARCLASATRNNERSAARERERDRISTAATVGSSSSVLIDLEDSSEPPLNLKKTKTDPVPSSPVRDDDEECLFVGIQPIVKKPPLDVITISSDDEDVKPRINVKSDESCSMTDWVVGRNEVVESRRVSERLQERLGIMASLQPLERGYNSDESDGAGPSTSVAAALDVGRRARTRACNSKKPRKKAKPARITKPMESTDTEEEEEETDDGKKKRKKTQAKPKSRKTSPAKKQKKSAVVPVSTTTSTPRKRKCATKSKPGGAKTKKSRAMIDTSSSSSTSFSDSSTSEDSRLFTLTRRDSSFLQTRRCPSQPAPPEATRRWESDNENDVGEDRPLLFAEIGSNSSHSGSSPDVMAHHGLSDNSNFGGFADDNQDWYSPASLGPTIDVTSSTSSAPSEDEAGLNARGVEDAFPATYERNGLFNAIIGSFDHSSRTLAALSFDTPSPPASSSLSTIDPVGLGLDLRRREWRSLLDTERLDDSGEEDEFTRSLHLRYD